MPVVATAVTGISEIVQNNETGLLVEQRNAVALARAIRCMAVAQGRALQMAETGKKLVRQMFDPKTNIRALYNLYVERFNAFRRRRDA